MSRFSWLAAVPAAALLSSLATSQLAITEVCDGTLSGGQPKFIQLTNIGITVIPDLSIYSFGNMSNGGTSLGGGSSTQLNAVSLAAGDSYVIAYEFDSNTACDPNSLVTCFEFVYGFPADQYFGPFINGDDALVLFLGNATGDGSDACILDVYGRIGTDGTGEAWEHTDGYSFRCGSTAPSGVWQPCDWTIGGVDSLQDPGGDDTVELGLLQSLTTPDANPGCVAANCDSVVYCDPLTSTNGCAATLFASASGMPFSGVGNYNITTVTAEAGVPALFFLSISGPFSNTAFNGGTLCIKPPVGRGQLGLTTSGANCSGLVQMTVNDPNTPWGMLGTPGTGMWIQLFYRDSGAPTGLGLSDAIFVRFR